MENVAAHATEQIKSIEREFGSPQHACRNHLMGAINTSCAQSIPDFVSIILGTNQDPTITCTQSSRPVSSTGYKGIVDPCSTKSRVPSMKTRTTEATIFEYIVLCQDWIHFTAPSPMNERQEPQTQLEHEACMSHGEYRSRPPKASVSEK